jgi:hypothetical protein
VITVGTDGKSVDDVEGAAPPTPGLLGSIQRSRVWTTLTYGLNYDIHKVRDCCILQVVMCALVSACLCRLHVCMLWWRLAYVFSCLHSAASALTQGMNYKIRQERCVIVLFAVVCVFGLSVLGSIKRSRVWRTLTYGLNYDIHKVRCANVWVA